MPDLVLIPLGLDDPSDDECDKQLNATMQGLVDGDIEAATAARTIHALIINSCEEGYPAGSNEEGESPATESGTGWMGYLWRTVGKVAIAVPAHHDGQNRLVAFLQELFRLPPHTIKFKGHDGHVWQTEFWEDAKKDDKFCQEMRLLDNGELSPSAIPRAFAHFIRQPADGACLRGILEANPRNLVAYLNWTAFLARVFAGGVLNTTRFSALGTDAFLGLHWPYNKQADQSEPYVLAAAEWMRHAAAATWELCDRKAYALRGYNVGRWARWEARFARVAADDSGFSQRAHEAATAALLQMERAKEGCRAGPSVVEALGLRVKDWEDDE